MTTTTKTSTTAEISR